MAKAKKSVMFAADVDSKLATEQDDALTSNQLDIKSYSSVTLGERPDKNYFDLASEDTERKNGPMGDFPDTSRTGTFRSLASG